MIVMIDMNTKAERNFSSVLLVANEDKEGVGMKKASRFGMCNKIFVNTSYLY